VFATSGVVSIQPVDGFKDDSRGGSRRSPVEVVFRNNGTVGYPDAPRNRSGAAHMDGVVV